MADIEELLSIMRTLRHPGGGCAWDRQQTYESLVPHTLEEAYEVAEVIEQGTLEDLPDELGDLLFQIVFYSRIAEEDARFCFADVVQAICAKLRRRHPQLFGTPEEAAQSGSWQQIKARERQDKSGTGGHLHGLGQKLPALSGAQKLQARAAEVGFDWQELGAVFATVISEFEELREVVEQGCAADRVEDELGDLLFSCVNLARHLNLDAERALRRASRKFERRFNFIEAALGNEGRSLAEVDAEKLNVLWAAAKTAGY